jgi:hypothetical protein
MFPVRSQRLSSRGVGPSFLRRKRHQPKNPWLSGSTELEIGREGCRSGSRITKSRLPMWYRCRFVERELTDKTGITTSAYNNVLFFSTISRISSRGMDHEFIRNIIPENIPTQGRNAGKRVARENRSDSAKISCKPALAKLPLAFTPAAGAWLPSVGSMFRVDIAPWMLLPGSRVREMPRSIRECEVGPTGWKGAGTAALSSIREIIRCSWE